jgi:hypothetical protein
VLAAAVSALAFHSLPHQLGLILAAVIGMAAGVAAETHWERSGHPSASQGE